MARTLKRNSKRVLRTRKKENGWINLIKLVYKFCDKGLKLLDDLLDIE